MRPPTYGLSHIALKVTSLDRAVAFYETAFGEIWHENTPHYDGNG